MRIQKAKIFTTLLILFTLFSGRAEAAKPLALVWAGPGACVPGCLPSALAVTRQTGFTIKRVYPGFKDYSLFKKAKIWVQPGGKSRVAAKSMGPELMNAIRTFVHDGGAYIGFCAGAFLSSKKIGQTDIDGLGIIPGETELLVKEGDDRLFLPMKTNMGNYKMYYAGGPYIKISDSELKAADGEVIARYEDGKIAGIWVRYGTGRVAVIGTHPEASFAWKAFHGFFDFRSTRFFARNMIKHVTSNKTKK